jgi:molecular chaperone DnaJ
VTAVDVSAPLAALGTTVAVTGLDGDVDLDIAPGTQPGEVLTVHGEGMPKLRRSGRRGDLRVVVNVVVPRRLTKEQRRLVSELAETMTPENVAADEGLFDKLRRLLG